MSIHSSAGEAEPLALVDPVREPLAEPLAAPPDSNPPPVHLTPIPATQSAPARLGEESPYHPMKMEPAIVMGGDAGQLFLQFPRDCILMGLALSAGAEAMYVLTKGQQLSLAQCAELAITQGQFVIVVAKNPGTDPLTIEGSWLVKGQGLGMVKQEPPEVPTAAPGAVLQPLESVHNQVPLAGHNEVVAVLKRGDCEALLKLVEYGTLVPDWQRSQVIRHLTDALRKA